MIIDFTVFGTPQPKGSTRAFMRPGMKFPVVTSDNPKVKPWAELIKYEAQRHAPAGGVWTGAVHIIAEFYLVRPKHLPKRVVDHLTKPDLDKLLRAVKDALKGVIYRDDSQVTDVVTKKRYGPSPGVHIKVATP